MGLFGNLFGRKEDKNLLNGVTLYDCVTGLLQDNPDDLTLRQARQFKGDFERLYREPGSYVSLFFTLMHYYGIVPRDMEIVANNVKSGASDLIEEAGDRDPYKAKALFETLFAKWPEAFHGALVSAEQEDTEENLVFLACVNLFGWCEGADAEKAKAYVEKIGALEDLQKPAVYEWLKARVEK